MSLGSRTTEDNLRTATRNSLLRARERGLRSIAFPAIGTGVAGFPLGRCAEVMLDEVRKHLAGTTSLERVEFVLFDAAALAEFTRALDAVPD
jgi:O-acetyl-ADP-ribose deacetylase (regulator of RNase III)